jgi:protoporphyrinogen oxidase
MNGHQVIIVEKEPEVGGLAKCIRFEGYTFDYGPHLIFGDKVLPLLREVLAPGLQLTPVRRDSERIHFDNRYFRFPFEPKNLLFNMKRTRVPRAMLGLLASSLSKKANHFPEKNLEDWVVRAVGRNLYEYTSLGGYVEKLYGIPARDIDEDWGIQKLKFLKRLEGSRLFQAGLSALKEKKTLASQVVHYPPHGIDQLAGLIGRNLTASGGRIFLRSKALAIEKKKNTVTLHFERGGQKEQVEADFLVSTIPLSRLTEMIRPEPPKDIGRASNLLRYRTLLLVLLCINKTHVLNYQCVYFTEKDIPFRRLTEFKNLDTTMAPEGKTSLCAEITCFDEDTICMSDEQSVCTSVVAELQKRGLIREEDVEHATAIRIPYAYPVYDVAYQRFLDKVLACLGKMDRLISVGRQGLFHYNNMSNSMIAGHEVGQALSVSEEASFERVIQSVYKARRGKYRVL